MQTTIRNDTPHILELRGAENLQITLAPLEQRSMADVSGFDLSEAMRAGKISHWNEPPSDTVEKVMTGALGLAMVLTVPCSIVAGANPRWGISEENWSPYVWLSGLAIVVFFVGVQVIYRTKSAQLVLRFLMQTLSLLAILAIGLGLPIATVYHFADGKTLLQGATPELFVRLLQVAFIATASLLPVLLYFLFDRYQLNTVRHRLYRDLFRLDRSLKTRSEIDARFGSQIREAYGPEEQGRGRVAPGTRWPVLVCAFVITMGWITAIRPIGPVNADLLNNPLSPTSETWTYGFLGAYFFALQLIARRFARGDLKPKAYGYITVRILTVAVLSWVLEALLPSDSSVKLGAAFLVGIVPDEFFTLVREHFRGRAPSRIIPDPEKHPLTRLEGIDLYDRARLEQEGIVNVEGLAHHELIQLVLGTSVPVPQLVDWMDQAILYLHVMQEPDDGTRRTLRQYGIRTATDLLTCWDAAKARGELDDFKKLLGGGGKPYRLEVIRDALMDDEWLDRVLDWRNDSAASVEQVTAVLRSAEARVQWAERLEQQGRHKAAIQALEEAVEVEDGAEARVRLARMFATSPAFSLRNSLRSREHARRAFELADQNIDVLRALIDVHEANGDWADALKACVAAIDALGDPKSDKEKRALLQKLQEQQTALSLKDDASRAAFPTVSVTVKDDVVRITDRTTASTPRTDPGPTLGDQ